MGIGRLSPMSLALVSLINEHEISLTYTTRNKKKIRKTDKFEGEGRTIGRMALN